MNPAKPPISQKLASKRHTDTLRISNGALGPVPACELDIKPLTVFIGRQGTGKSLVAQVLYFFEELPHLTNFVDASSRTRQPSQKIVRAALDQLRSHERAFAAFANPHVTLEYRRSAPLSLGRKSLTLRPLKFSAYSNNRVVTADKHLRNAVDAVRDTKTAAIRNAVFFPTERLVISQLRKAIAAQVLSLPITYTLFADWMEMASEVLSTTDTSPEAKYVSARAAEALGGTVVRRGDQWKWRYGKGPKQQFDLDMASSGQRANWSIFYLARALFALRGTGQFAESLSVFVEEPEIHLHPAAQVVVAEVLAFLVRQGFRVVLSTHSLTVVYALNNLIQAHRLVEEEVEGTPAVGLRLDPKDVAVYAFGEGKPRSLVDPSSGFIDERALGSVAEDLTASMNAIGAHLPPVEE